MGRISAAGKENNSLSMSTIKKRVYGPDWEITTDRFVGFIDIMGFKDLVARNTHDKVYRMMLKVYAAMKLSESVFGVDSDKVINIKMMTYSDSIMIYSKDSSPNSQENFIAAVSSVTEDLFLNEIPHKGAVAFGTMTLDFEKSIFFGQPLIDAYLLQEELGFYGIVVHSSAEYRRGFRNDEVVVEHNCPFKSGTGRHHTILPTTFYGIEKSEYESLMLKISRLRIKTSGGLRKYIDNTLYYFTTAYKLLSRTHEVLED